MMLRSERHLPCASLHPGQRPRLHRTPLVSESPLRNLRCLEGALERIRPTVKRMYAVDEIFALWVFGKRDRGIRSGACGRGRGLKEDRASCVEDRFGGPSGRDGFRLRSKESCEAESVWAEGIHMRALECSALKPW